MKNRRRKKKKSLLKRIFIFLLIVAIAAVALIGVRYFINRQKVVKLDEIEMPDWIKSEIIEVDGTSRSGEKLSSVKDIVVHYVGNPEVRQNKIEIFMQGTSLMSVPILLWV